MSACCPRRWRRWIERGFRSWCCGGSRHLNNSRRSVQVADSSDDIDHDRRSMPIRRPRSSSSQTTIFHVHSWHFSLRITCTGADSLGYFVALNMSHFMITDISLYGTNVTRYARVPENVPRRGGQAKSVGNGCMLPRALIFLYFSTINFLGIPWNV